ncbi:hypothetical protein C8J57DRAFT_1377981 [Mycena rebaudengoi]|nr:hypothetical protein C8J57DRAFT_1377981 [Mycena rebaudengoi]
MPTMTPENAHFEYRRSVTTALRELAATIALCFIITLALLHFIAFHATAFHEPSKCDTRREWLGYHLALANISQWDVLKVTTVSALVAFIGMELCAAVGRRLGISRLQDVEQGPGIVCERAPVPEKQRTDDMEKL